MSIGYVWEELFLEHETGEFHPESPNRLLAVKDVIDDVKVAMFLTRLEPRPATRDELAYVHTEEYIKKIESVAGKTAQLDNDTRTSPKTFDAALLAAGGVIACVDYVMAEEHSHGAFAFVRPPGHHAEGDRAMGFCIFNNVAIGAEYALKKKGVKRVAILDFDVHHGNGTQNHFYARDDVFFASSHRSPYYPGTGCEAEIGIKEGRGFTVNAHLRGGMGDEDFHKIWGNRIIPSAKEFNPELILVSAGFDAHESDPMGGMRVTTGGFRWLASKLVELSKQCCNGRIVFVLEGGYSLSAIRSCVRATLEEMF